MHHWTPEQIRPMINDVLKILVLITASGCSLYSEDAPLDAAVIADAAEANICGPAPVGPEWANWDPTFDAASVTFTRLEYEKVQAFRDKTLRWMSCRVEFDAL